MTLGTSNSKLLLFVYISPESAFGLPGRMSDEYSSVATGKLKLKTDGCSDMKKKSKKRKRDKDKLKTSAELAILEEMRQEQTASGGRTDGQAMAATSSGPARTLTKAELAFKKQQEKTVRKRLDIDLILYEPV